MISRVRLRLGQFVNFNYLAHADLDDFEKEETKLDLRLWLYNFKNLLIDLSRTRDKRTEALTTSGCLDGFA